MKILLTYGNTNYSIIADGIQFTLNRLGVNSKTGAETESPLGYFQNIPNAISKLIKDGIGQSNDTVTLKEYCERIEAANADIKRQLQAVE